MSQALAVSRLDLDGFEGLREAVKGTRFAVVQLGRGNLRGHLSHIGIGGLAFSVGRFDLGVRVQRVADDDEIMIGMLLSSTGRVTQWSCEQHPADVIVVPPMTEHHAVHHDASSYAAIRLAPRELPVVFAGDPWLSDPQNWREKKHCRANGAAGALAAHRLPLIADHLARRGDQLSQEAALFWKRTIADCMATTVASSLPLDENAHLPSALKMVRHVENYIEAAGNRPLHVADLCLELRASRRTLHRAFNEVFGIGPVTFLRQKRLCVVHAILKRSAPGTTTVAEVAHEQGFIELGRFSQYYRTMFGEYPSQTLGGPASRDWRREKQALPQTAHHFDSRPG